MKFAIANGGDDFNDIISDCATPSNTSFISDVSSSFGGSVDRRLTFGTKAKKKVTF